ncbi:hypothetical protein AVEN_217070-1 [Araneus ventricosus]|uniref:Uncharacterized protein n=1 Tax=Araneus ventricosus TaxID=182803 RepID=A0A4Y2NMN8_ARAVE|nr:hypothetical protein AVEN_217070-1 [Araneus ventricosus]
MEAACYSLWLSYQREHTNTWMRSCRISKRVLASGCEYSNGRRECLLLDYCSLTPHFPPPQASHHHHHHHQQQQQQRDQPQHHHQRRNRRESSVDLAAVTEAHGLVSDMLADPQLPPHILSGLRTLSTLLSPTPASTSSSSCCAPQRVHHRRSPQRRKASLILPYFRSSSDNEEIPFTGERPSALPKV